MKSSIKQNLILVTATVICMVLAFVLGINLAMPSVVALEQDARCGMVEHVHRDECYLNNVLICGERAHTHGENCYLLRLEDNDINRILSEIEADEEKSLEHVITNVVYKASYLELVNEGILPAPTPTPTPTPTPLIELLPEGSSLETLTATNASVAALNDSIEENNITPALYLNERLISPASEGGTVSNSENIVNLTQGQNSPTDLITYAAGNDNANGGISTLAVGDSAATTGDNVNFYIMLNDELVCIGHKALRSVSIQQNYRNYTYYCTTRSDTAERYNDGLISNITADNISYNNNGTYYLRYTTSNPSNEDSFSSGSAQRPRNNNYYNDYLSFGTSGGLKHAIITTRTESGNWWGTTYTYTPVDFYTVTLDRSKVGGTNSVQYVQSGQNSTLTLDSAYNWYTENGTQVTSVNPASGGITSTTTLYARPKQITVKITFLNSDNSTYETKTITSAVGESTVTVEMPNNGNFVWIIQGDDSKCWEPGDTYTTNKDTTFKAVPALYTVTYIDNNGASKETTVGYLGKAKMPSLPDGWVWKNGENYYSVGEEVTVKSDMTFTAVSGCAVTYIDANGDTTTTVVAQGKSHTITKNPGTGYVWVDEDGNQHNVGDKLVVNDSITLTAVKPITITYTVNFPSFNYPVSGNQNLYNRSGGTAAGATAVGTPVMKNGNASTLTINNYANPNAPHVVEATNYREVFYQNTEPPGSAYRSVYLLGWEVTVGNTTRLYTPGQNINWDELMELAGNGSTINFRGVWENSGQHSVSFYIIFNAKAVASGGNFPDGNPADYTPELFGAHLFGIPDIDNITTAKLTTHYGIAGKTATSSIDADKKIRELYGAGVTYDFTDDNNNNNNNTSTDYNTTLKMTDFPKDADILALMKELGRNGAYADGNGNNRLRADVGDGTTTELVPCTVSVRGNTRTYDYYDLDADHYTVRWYVFKSHDDAWHVDGRLIKKVGTIAVTKTFGGNASLVEAVREASEKMDDPFITATNDATGSDARTVSLYFKETTNDGKDNGYTYDSETDTYKWIIRDVKAGEKWIIKESPPKLNDAVTLPEWIIADSLNGTVVSGNTHDTNEIVGITQAGDEITEDWLTADFVNMYHLEDTILIRKVDGISMNGLAGAKFNLIQRTKHTDETYTYDVMYFTYDAQKSIYVWSQNGASDPKAIKDLAVTESGYLEYSLGGFTFENGDIIVREIETPEGYVTSPDIIVGYIPGSNDDEDGDSIPDGHILGYGAGADPSTVYATYENHVLTVKNFAMSDTTVTAEKKWDCDPSYYEGLAVKVELLANGKLASETIPGFSNTYGSYTVWLDENGSYTLNGTQKVYSQYNGEKEAAWKHVWKGLPAAINSNPITWSLRETQVGTEVTDATGNFPNWIFSYSTSGYGTSDGYFVNLTVSNTPNRAMIRLNKLEPDSKTPIPGVGFTLVELDKNGNETSTVKSGITSDVYGILDFDTLKYQTWYKLTETSRPAGYLPNDSGPIYLRIEKTGAVTVTTAVNGTEEHPNAYYPGQANNVYVTNTPGKALPETGGMGTHIYTAGGLLLMAAAVALLIYRRKRRKEADLLDV